MLFKVYFFSFKHRKKFLKKAVILKYFQKNSKIFKYCQPHTLNSNSRVILVV